MIDTNALLSIAFSLIAQFTNVVQIAPQAVPQKPDDLASCVIGGPVSPVHLILTHRSGTEFWIGHGAVYEYSSPGSYFNLRQPASLDRFYGKTMLTSNDVVRIAGTVLQRLAKHGNPLTDMSPRVRLPTSERIPFFEVNWLTPLEHGGSARSATVEIDGRDGAIVRLILFGSTFADLSLDQDIKKRVYTPDRVRLRPPAKRFPYPKPTTNYVSRAIERWFVFCDKLGLEPGGQTNLEDVNWDDTFVYTNPVSHTMPACRITFTNRTFFDALGGVPFNHFGADAAFTGRYMSKPAAEWTPFEGEVTRRWEDLAKELETRTSQMLGVSKTFFEQSKPTRTMMSANVGTHGLARTLVYWHRLPPLVHGSMLEEDERSLLSAEFDLQTGKVKFIDFHDPQLITLIGRALGQKQ